MKTPICTGDTFGYDKPVFGVEFLDTVDHYTKNERTVKYAFLLITLTFAVYFFCEVLKKQKVHPLQYGLVGAALVIFFILLLSLSEHIGFDPAYGVASVSTILLITFIQQKYFFRKEICDGRGQFVGSLVWVHLYHPPARRLCASRRKYCFVCHHCVDYVFDEESEMVVVS